MSGYLALVQHYLPDAKPLEKSTTLLLDHKVALPPARCRHETALVDSADVMKQTILFDMEEKVRQGHALSSVGKAEDENVAGKGSGLTKGEISELTQVRSHVLWGLLFRSWQWSGLAALTHWTPCTSSWIQGYPSSGETSCA